MKQAGRLIKVRHVDTSQLSAGYEDFQKIVDDMRVNGGILVPNSVWLTVDPSIPIGSDTTPYLEEISSEAAFEEKYATMDKMLFGWIGSGTFGITPNVLRSYGRLVERCDPLGLWEANVEDPEARGRLVAGDLGSIMDLNLIFSFASRGTARSFILEVGGGYGRLAEAALNVLGNSIFYVLVDSVPGSLYYAKRYLEQACPDRAIGSYYNGDPFDPDRFDCYVAPSWRFEELNAGAHSYDVCVNVESFQEMSQEHVDYYLDLFDRVAAEGAAIYASNSHDYLFQGDWNYPDRWRKVFCHNTPRSWTRKHPTEVFVKGTRDFSRANAAVDAAYAYTNEPADVEGYLAKVGARAALVPVARHFGRRAVNRARHTLRRQT